MEDKCLLEVRNINKSFSGVKVLNDINFKIKKGEILGFVGENGAGKSTLMKIISGVLSHDTGKLYFNSKEYKYMNPKLSKELGINVIYQELNLFSKLNISDNIFFGNEVRKEGFLSRLGVIDSKKTLEKTRDILKKFGLPIMAFSNIEKFSLANRQLIEIARAISFDFKLLIMDEPTSSLTERESEFLISLIRKLKDEGKSIIFISHRIDEIVGNVDRIIVLRDGIKVGELEGKEINDKRVIKLMVGKEIEGRVKMYDSDYNNMLRKEIFRVEKIKSNKLKKISAKTGEDYKGVSFSLCEGEVLGLAGLMGSGRTEIADVIFGMDKIASGKIFMHGREIKIRNPKDAINFGIGYIPEDRKKIGLVLLLSLIKNMSLSSLRYKFSKFGIIENNKEKNSVLDFVKELDIKCFGLNQVVNHLSGGNQQKVVLGKALLLNPKVLIMDEPTRGIDIGTKFYIYNLIRKLARERKVAIILISSELDEIINLSDKVLIVKDGIVKDEYRNYNLSKNKIMHLILSDNGNKN